MNVFLDTSVLLAACGRSDGASAIIVRSVREWRLTLFTCRYVLDEVERNLPRLGPTAAERWPGVLAELHRVSDVLTFPRLVVFFAGKDRPVLFTAAACADVLLTFDRRDFIKPLGTSFYGLSIEVPGTFLERF